MSLEVAVIITAIVFTCVGAWFGFNANSRAAIDKTIEVLEAEGYIKFHEDENGEKHFVKHR
jgi:hypothetical protein